MIIKAQLFSRHSSQALNELAGTGVIMLAGLIEVPKNTLSEEILHTFQINEAGLRVVPVPPRVPEDSAGERPHIEAMTPDEAARTEIWLPATGGLLELYTRRTLVPSSEGEVFMVFAAAEVSADLLRLLPDGHIAEYQGGVGFIDSEFVPESEGESLQGVLRLPVWTVGDMDEPFAMRSTLSLAEGQAMQRARELALKESRSPQEAEELRTAAQVFGSFQYDDFDSAVLRRFGERHGFLHPCQPVTITELEDYGSKMQAIVDEVEREWGPELGPDGNGPKGPH